LECEKVPSLHFAVAPLGLVLPVAAVVGAAELAAAPPLAFFELFVELLLPVLAEDFALAPFFCTPPW
jgi:hypothetical protein